MNRRRLLGILAAAGSLPLSGMSVARSQALLEAVATTGMIADCVSAVGEGRVSVAGLMGPGVDPHGYRQTSSDISRMVRADAVFWHGLYLEAQLEDFLGQLQQRVPVFALAESLPKDRLIGEPGGTGRYDPHVWMDPMLWVGVVDAAVEALAKIDPDGRDTYVANAVSYRASIEAVGAYAQAALASVPADRRVLVTAHDAFSYFGRAYGYEVLAIQGISTQSEAGLQKIEQLVGVLVERRIGAIFVESSVSDRNLRALIEGAAARGHAVVIGGELFSDAMGAPGTYEGTYVGMIDHNVTVIAAALGGDVPEAGMAGRLGSAG